MNPGSVGRKVKPKVRVVTMMVIMWFVVRSVMGIKVPRIIMMVSMNLVVPAMIFVMVPMTGFVMLPVIILVVVSVASSVMVPLHSSVMFPVIILVMVSIIRPSTAIPCLRWRRPSNYNHCHKSYYSNLTDIFHFDS